MKSFEKIYREIDTWAVDDDAAKILAHAEVILDDLHFHAILRFSEFDQFEIQEGDYGARLYNFVCNVDSPKQRAALLKLAEQITFLDRSQRDSLLREAYRKHILPWLEDHHLGKDTTAFAEEDDIKKWLTAVQFISLTESFDFPRFFQVNDLDGIRKPIILGEEKNAVKLGSANIVIVQEDIVGSGSTAGRRLRWLRDNLKDSQKLMFCGGVALPGAEAALREKIEGTDIHVCFCHQLAESERITPDERENEPDWIGRIREIVIENESRIFATEDGEKLAFENFGYGSVGAFFASFHNVPNNSLPLIFRRTASWRPLFPRREAIYETKDGYIRS